MNENTLEECQRATAALLLRHTRKNESWCKAAAPLLIDLALDAWDQLAAESEMHHDSTYFQIKELIQEWLTGGPAWQNLGAGRYLDEVIREGGYRNLLVSPADWSPVVREVTPDAPVWCLNQRHLTPVILQHARGEIRQGRVKPRHRNGARLSGAYFTRSDSADCPLLGLTVFEAEEEAREELRSRYEEAAEESQRRAAAYRATIGSIRVFGES